MKYALLVGLGTCPRNLGISLSGTDNDLALVSSILIKRFKFNTVCVLKDGSATLETVCRELKRIVSKAGPGDDVLFYFTGHGSVLPDLDNDESDSYDECLVLHDHHPDNAFTDDILAKCLKGLHSEAYLTLVLDSCHSGGLIGSEDIMSKLNEQNDRSAVLDTDTINAESFTSDNTRKVGKKNSPEGPSGQRHILVSACSEGGVCFEFAGLNRRSPKKKFGLLTYLLVKQLRPRKNKSVRMDWKSLHKRLAVKVLRKTEGVQVPILYGRADLMDRGPFGILSDEG